MIDYPDALREVVSRARPLAGEPVPLAKALGRTLARDVRAGENIPPFTKATMDGYAVRAADTVPREGAAEVELRVIEDLPAGRVSRKTLGTGQAARIMTGAPLPKGADAVVMVEDTAPRHLRKTGFGHLAPSPARADAELAIRFVSGPSVGRQRRAE